MKELNSVREMWIKLIAELSDVDKDTIEYEAWHFCSNQKMPMNGANPLMKRC